MAANVQNFGTQIPTSNVWDLSEIQEVTKDPKMQELLVRLYQNLNRMALATNIKDAGFYVQEEFVNGQSFFAKTTTNSQTAQAPAMRQAFRFVVNFGALPNAGLNSVTTTLTPTASWTMTRIYGAATNPNTEYIPLPYASNTPNANIELYADINAGKLRVNVVTALDYSAYTTTYIVLEYIKT